jgi:hypothetical protein
VDQAVTQVGRLFLFSRLIGRRTRREKEKLGLRQFCHPQARRTTYNPRRGLCSPPPTFTTNHGWNSPAAR